MGRSVSTARHLIVNGKKIRAMAVKDPAQLPWKQLEADIVVESTGIFTVAQQGRQGGLRHAPDSRREEGDLERSGEGRRRSHLRARRERRQADQGDEVHLQRKLHDKLPGAGRQGAARQVRHRQRFDDDGPRLHERPERAGPAAQGPVSRPRRRAQHHPQHHRRRNRRRAS